MRPGHIGSNIFAGTYQRQVKFSVELDVRLFRHLIRALWIQLREAPVLVGDFLHRKVGVRAKNGEKSSLMPNNNDRP